MAMKQPGRIVHRSANGKAVDMDMLRQRNELTPAVGNARVNARGDQLGAGGRIVRKKEDLLKDYYAAAEGMQEEQPVAKYTISFYHTNFNFSFWSIYRHCASPPTVFYKNPVSDFKHFFILWTFRINFSPTRINSSCSAIIIFNDKTACCFLFSKKHICYKCSIAYCSRCTFDCV